jgi:hypothetical protein
VTSDIQPQIDDKLDFYLEQGKIFVGDINDEPARVTVSGDISIGYTGIAEVNNDAVIGKYLSGVEGITESTKVKNEDTILAGIGKLQNQVSAISIPDTSGFLLKSLDTAEIFVGDSNSVAQGVAMSGGATISKTGAVTLNAATLKSTTLATELTGLDTNTATAIVGTDTVLTAFGKAQAQIDDINASPSIPALNSAQIFVGSSSNVATAVNMSGDATISNTGAVTLTSATLYSATRATPLTGLSLADKTDVVSTDTVLSAVGKLQAQIDAGGGGGGGGTWGSITGDIEDQTDLALALGAKEPANANIQSHISSTNNPHSVTPSQLTLTGLNTTSNTAVVGTDTVLAGVGKLQAQETATRTALADTGRTGVLAWSGSGNYHSWTPGTPGTFTLLRGGTGYIRGNKITWAGSQRDRKSVV